MGGGGGGCGVYLPLLQFTRDTCYTATCGNTDEDLYDTPFLYALRKEGVWLAEFMGFF